MAILGIDEVGRGPWAGPLVIGACILPEEKPEWVDELNDSKKLSVKKREELNKIILKEALATGIGWVTSEEIDKIGLAEALKLACRRAVEEIQKTKVPFAEIIIDGTVNFLKGTALEKYVTVLKKADFLIKEVSAASIIAKVARDNYMYDLAKKYPEYGFEKHVGYGTAVHKKALEQYGACPEHRKSVRPVEQLFFSSATRGEEFRPAGNSSPVALRLYSSKKSCSTAIGTKAENVVAEYLVQNGHQIVARNHKTRFYEIDIVSIKDDTIYFTEVKYRKNSNYGSPLEFITKEKQKQMAFAAESFLKYKKEFQKYSPVLAAAAVSGEDFKIEEWLVI